MDISELVEHYRRNRESYTSAQYNETQLRRENLDSLFTLLGWDIDNKHRYAEACKDVVHEDAIRTGVSTKAPDYSFRIGGARKFFVEAKKPLGELGRPNAHPPQTKQAAAKTAYEKTAIERQIDATDRQIDTLVYDLCGPTEEEINIVEQNI
jgi:hypothetical protein